MKKRLLFILITSFITSISAFAQTKTVTNADLEKFRQKRLQSEREYRETYEKSGFPSPEELERQRQQRRTENEEAIIRQREERLENESDYAARATALRSEIASVEAQINYVLSLFPANQPPTSYFTGGVAPFGYTSGGRSNSIWSGDATGRVFFGGGYNRYGRSGFGGVRQIPHIRNPYGRGSGYNNGGIRLNSGAGNIRLRARAGYNQYGQYGRYNQYGKHYGYGSNQFYGYTPVIVDKYDYSQDELAGQLRSLEQERAGLYAEWRLLQERAKRAGVKID